MKKILSLLGSLSLTAGSVITVISCTPGTEVNDPQEMSEAFNKILGMNAQEKEELGKTADKWLIEFEHNDPEKQSKVQALLDETVETFPEGISDEYFNNEYLYHAFSLVTVDILEIIEQDHIGQILFGNMNSYKNLTTNKFINAKNKLWLKNLLDHYEKWEKSFDFNKISKMTEEQKDNANRSLDIWIKSNESSLTFQQAAELLTQQLTELPENVTEQYFNDVFLFYVLTRSTLEIIKDVQSGVTEINEDYVNTFDDILKNKFTNSKNKTWIQNIKTWVETQKSTS